MHNHGDYKCKHVSNYILLKCLYNFSDVVAIGEYTLHACGQSENTVHIVMLSTCKLVKKKV